MSYFRGAYAVSSVDMS